MDSCTPNLPESLLADPHALRNAWAALMATHAHLHGAEAAQRLGVPEAAVFASRVGAGALELSNDLRGVLEPAGAWGKLLVAGRNQLGVALLILDDVRVSIIDGQIRLVAPERQALLATQGIARCYLLEERDSHGYTFSLNWFDAAGDVIGRLFLMSKSGREAALPHIRTFSLPVQTLAWEAGTGPQAPMVEWVDRPASHGALAGGTEASRLGERGVLACRNAHQMDIEMTGRGVAVRYAGPLSKTFATPPAVHATDAGCKLHLRMGGVVSAHLCAGQAGHAGLRLMDAGGGYLTLIPSDQHHASLEWLGKVRQEARQ